MQKEEGVSKQQSKSDKSTHIKTYFSAKCNPSGYPQKAGQKWGMEGFILRHYPVRGLKMAEAEPIFP